MSARWKMTPRETGLRAVGAAPRRHDLRENGEVLLTVAPSGGGWRGPVKGWYWYGMGRNTYGELRATPEEAKVEAMAWFKANREQDE